MLTLLLLCFFVICAAWNWFYEKNWNRKISVTLHFDTQAVYAGESAKLYELIENRKRLPIPILEMGFHIQKGLVFKDCENVGVSDHIYKRDVFSIFGKQRITRQIDIQCARRGYYKIEKAELTSFALLYYERYSEYREAEAELYVYPAKAQISEILSVCEQMIGTMQCTKRLYEDPFAFRSIREYTPEDSIRTINWKASAKSGGLMVNTFDSVLTQKAMVYLDVEDCGIRKYPQLIEDSISVAVTLVRQLMNRGMEIGFSTNALSEQGTAIEVAPTNKKPELTRLQRMMAKYRSEHGCVGFAASFGTLNEDMVQIFISKNITKELYSQIAEFVGKDRLAIIICPVEKGEKLLLPKPDRRNIRLIPREVERS